jgi:D-threo-aldose 1-dehydrogenase
MKAITKQKLGRSSLDVTALGFGTAPLGDQFKVVSEEESRSTFDLAWDAGVRYFDTAPMYGHGLAEHRTGEALRHRPRGEYILSTKVGRMLMPAKRETIDFTPWVDALPFRIAYDYTYDATMRSIEHSLQRLALEFIDIAFIHDIDGFTHAPERQGFYFRQAMDGAFKALHRLRDEGVLKAIGVGVNEWQVCEAALREADFDCFLLAGRYTLLEQDALDSFLPLCEQRGVAVALGGCFNSGILATGAIPGARYNYAPASPAMMDRVARIEGVCSEFSVSLKAAAQQFVLAHPCIPTVLVGTSKVAHLQDNIDLLTMPIPHAFWRALKDRAFIKAEAPVPSAT